MISVAGSERHCCVHGTYSLIDMKTGNNRSLGNRDHLVWEDGSAVDMPRVLPADRQPCTLDSAFLKRQLSDGAAMSSWQTLGTIALPHAEFQGLQLPKKAKYIPPHEPP